ncbi:MAG: hypothetical protein FGM45_04645 [Actinobacteria bacterium]|nr:hypothetical protein [Actinomycetota bacterium]
MFRHLARVATPSVITVGLSVGLVVVPVSLDPVSAQTQVSSTALPRQGDRGSAVVNLQKALLSAGVTVPGGPDGVFGRGTAGALAQFQRSAGLNPSGALDPTSAHLLGLAPAPALPTRGQRGDAVRTLQNALVTAGIPVRGGVDGIFGSGTAAAVSAFQAARGLTASGLVDVRTAIALGIAPGAAPVATPSPAPTTVSAPTTVPAPTPAPASAVSPSPAPVLPAVGQRGEPVAVLQRALIAAGLNVRGGADGIFGAATTTALRSYQEQMKVPATGALDENTARLLGLLPAPALPAVGESSDGVRRLQQRLIEVGIHVAGGADGVFGKATSRAIADFQKSRGLATTGVVDLHTFVLVTTTPNSTTPSPEAAPKEAAIAPSVFPVQGPCWFADTWKAPRPGGRRHLGVDIIAPTGKAVYAVTDGTITRQFLDRPGSLGGNALRLTAADGTYFHYAHFSSFADGIAVGSVVKAGQVIGYVGSTGNSSSPHLHFEYHPHGTGAVNPFAVVKAIDACQVTELRAAP